MPDDSAVLSHLMSRKEDHALPRDLYVSRETLDADFRHIFYKEWIFAGPSCDIPKTGNYITVQLGEYSVIVVRGADGEIRAFHNSCRHRGSIICREHKGSAPKLVCPYHQWTYELDGRLLFARDMGSDFDAAQFGLKPVHCHNASGMVFICVAEEAPDLQPLLDHAARYLAPHKLEDCKVAFESRIVEKGNWKLVIENNRECYHCSSNHPELSRSFDDRPIISGETQEDGADDLTQAHVDRCEAAGMASEFVIAPTRQWRFLRLPLNTGMLSMTMDGKPASSKLLGTMPFKDAGTLVFFHYPNSWNHFLADHCVTFRVLPISPTETEVVTRWLVHKDAVEGEDYDLDHLTEVWLATNDSDRRVVEENQMGVNSPAYEPGPYCRLHEDGVVEYVGWYARTMIANMTGKRIDRSMDQTG